MYLAYARTQKPKAFPTFGSQGLELICFCYPMLRRGLALWQHRSRTIRSQNTAIMNAKTGLVNTHVCDLPYIGLQQGFVNEPDRHVQAAG